MSEAKDGGEEDPCHCYRLQPHRLGFDDGASIFLHGKFGDPCIQCGDVSDALCDFPLGEEGRTCDRPLCVTCAPEVGVDRHYCREHIELGPGLLLFRRPAVIVDVQKAMQEVRKEMEAPTARPRAKRLPKAPHPDRRWRVLEPNYRLHYSELGKPLTRWMSEASARAYAAERGGIVESWGQFVIAWRSVYPLKKQKRPPPK